MQYIIETTLDISAVQETAWQIMEKHTRMDFILRYPCCCALCAAITYYARLPIFLFPIFCAVGILLIFLSERRSLRRAAQQWQTSSGHSEFHQVACFREDNILFRSIEKEIEREIPYSKFYSMKETKRFFVLQSVHVGESLVLSKHGFQQGSEKDFRVFMAEKLKKT